MNRILPKSFVALLFLALSQQTWAETPQHKLASFLSGTGNQIFLAAGVLMPVLTNESDGKVRSLRSADALLTSAALSEGLKLIVRERRPGSGTADSFPSGHATAAFAVATMESVYHPKQAIFWYGGATLISGSRVALHVHYVHDVIVGTALGYATAKLELNSKHGLLLYPVISSASGNGVGFNFRF